MDFQMHHDIAVERIQVILRLINRQEPTEKDRKIILVMIGELADNLMKNQEVN